MPGQLPIRPMNNSENTGVNRFAILDILRGAAIILMVAFHFCYDLSYFKLAHFDFYNDLFWLHARTFILGFFLTLVGVSLWVAHNNRIRLYKALKRAALIALNAGLVSMSTWYLFGDRVVFFGVLHFIVVASLLGLLFVRHRLLSLIAGLSLIGMGAFHFAWFDQPWIQWVGMMTYKPATEDYVPIIPWLGVVFLGIYTARWIPVLNQNCGAINDRLQALAFVGRHSLLIYMLHQPVMIGVLKLITGMQPPG